MFSRDAISLLLNPSPMRPTTSLSRVVILTESMAIARLFTTASFAICEKSDEVIAGGSTRAPLATERMVPTSSSNVASFNMKPDTPAFTKSTMSSCTGSRSMMITLDSGCSRFTISATLRLSSSQSPTSRRITSGLASLNKAGSPPDAVATTLKSLVWFSRAAMPSRTIRLSSMSATEIMLGQILRSVEPGVFPNRSYRVVWRRFGRYPLS